MKFLSRLWIALPLVLVVVGSAEAQTVKVNDEYQAKLPIDPVKIGRVVGLGGKGGTTYMATLPIKLEANQTVTVTVNVGKDKRILAVALIDKDGSEIGVSPGLKAHINGQPNQTALQALAAGFAKTTGSTPGPRGPDPLLPSLFAKFTTSQPIVGGEYTVVVLSNFSGEFTLNVVDDKAAKPKRDTDAIRKELQQAEKRVEELKKELKDAEKTPATIGK